MLLERYMIRREDVKKRPMLGYVQHFKSVYTLRRMVHKLLSVGFHYQTNFALFCQEYLFLHLTQWRNGFNCFCAQ